MFKSAMYPAVVEFFIIEEVKSDPSKEKDEEEEEEDELAKRRKTQKIAKNFGIEVDKAEHIVDRNNNLSRKVIFKTGDDLRQDQLVMQMIQLMDSLLKKVNLDLKLRPYGILATGKSDGLMEFVANSSAVSAVLSDHGTITAYLAHHNEDPTSQSGIKPEVIDTFVKSCAGYCVITYLLGIGDRFFYVFLLRILFLLLFRHLDNLMMIPEGNLFHIDFGFILGRDPKPLPPPFRFTKEMCDVMGGTDGEDYQAFLRNFSSCHFHLILFFSVFCLVSDQNVAKLIFY